MRVSIVHQREYRSTARLPGSSWPCSLQSWADTRKGGLSSLKRTGAYAQHVGLGDESGIGLEQPRVGDLGLVENTLHIGIFGEVENGQPGGRVVRGRRGERRGLDYGGAGEVVVEDGLAIGLEDRLGGHYGY